MGFAGLRTFCESGRAPNRGEPMSNDHDQALARAFDVQAPRFERAPVQSDPAALERLVQFAGFPPGSRILDAGCGPGLVCEALLSAGYRVVGVDLSREMIERARRRCEPVERPSRVSPPVPLRHRPGRPGLLRRRLVPLRRPPRDRSARLRGPPGAPDAPRRNARDQRPSY